MPVPFRKPARSVPEQITLLEQHGLVVNDAAEATHFLTHVGYYRLSGYWHIFQNDPVNHTFYQGTTFKAVMEQYDFDRQLRMLLYDSIERIEISFRNLMVDQMCLAYGSHWYADEKYGQNLDYFRVNLEKVSEELNRSKEEFIRHHDAKYGDGYPPAWMTMQVLSLGTLSKIYCNINSQLPEKNLIARRLGLPNYVYLESWIQSISIVRNFCAHHSRIINRNYDFPPKRMATSPYSWIKRLPLNLQQQGLPYNQLCVIKFLLDRVSPGNHFSKKLLELIENCPGISLQRMGFPLGWEEELLWS